MGFEEAAFDSIASLKVLLIKHCEKVGAKRTEVPCFDTNHRVRDGWHVDFSLV